MRMPAVHPAAVLPWLLLGLSAPAARATVAAWLDFNGAIKGEATEARHKAWIDVESFTVGVDRAIPPRTGGGTGAAKPSLHEVTLNKLVDRASPDLFVAATTGDPYPNVTIDLNTNSTTSGMIPLVRIELENVLVSAQAVTGSTDGADKPSESISLNFEKIIFTYYTPDGSSIHTDYDLTSNVSSTGTTLVDSDGDGMPDSWETACGLNAGANDANGDLDGDGLTNLQEYQLGTLPNSATSFFRAELTPDPATPGTHRISWNSVVGKTYVIEWSPNLSTPFTTLRTVTATAASTTETINHTGATGFYRVRPQS